MSNEKTTVQIKKRIMAIKGFRLDATTAFYRELPHLKIGYDIESRATKKIVAFEKIDLPRGAEFIEVEVEVDPDEEWF